MQTVATIGVYGFTGESFLRRLQVAGVDLVADVRQRRGVRGPDYAWANSRRLQDSLARLGVAYNHFPELAPTTELRQLQYREDARMRVGKRSRVELAAEYRDRYTGEILDRTDLRWLLASLAGASIPALLCVEREAAACHRSLIAERVHQLLEVPFIHLLP